MAKRTFRQRAKIEFRPDKRELTWVKSLYMTRQQRLKLLKWLLMTLGTLLLAAGVYFFKFPNNFSTGGVSGISVILGHYFPNSTPGDFMMVINVVLLIIANTTSKKFSENSLW